MRYLWSSGWSVSAFSASNMPPHLTSAPHSHPPTFEKEKEMQDDEARDNWYRSLTSAQRAEVDAKDRAEYATRRLANPRFGDGWQPISTAPKDGTPILGYSMGDKTTVRWVVGHREWHLCETGLYASEIEWSPTHWMPLPPDPID